MAEAAGVAAAVAEAAAERSDRNSNDPRRRRLPRRFPHLLQLPRFAASASRHCRRWPRRYRSRRRRRPARPRWRRKPCTIPTRVAAHIRSKAARCRRTAGNRNDEIRDRMFMSPPTRAICGVAERLDVRVRRHLRSTNGVTLVQGHVGTISRGLIECDVKDRFTRGRASC